MASKKKATSKKKSAGKKIQLRDLPKRKQGSADEQANAVKGGYIEQDNVARFKGG